MHRKWWIAAAVLPALAWITCGCDIKKNLAPTPTGGNIVVNEFLASNHAYGQDECGSYSDWIELYNRSDHAIDIGGYYITDDLTKPTKFQIPTGHSAATTIPSHGFLLIWCDGQACTQGVLHTTFSLGAGGEQIGLYDASETPLEQITFGPQTGDVSYGRTTDGGSGWAFLTPTPGASNNGGAHGGPVISSVTLDPSSPGAGAAVTVRAEITDAVSMVGAYLSYKVGSGSFASVTMTQSGTTWSGTIPGQALGAVVSYYVRAIDSADSVRYAPPTAPGAVYTYTVGGGVTPTLFINEFVASNQTGIQDSLGNYPDWIEVYNPGASPVDIGGMYTTDDLTIPAKWQIPAGTSATIVPAHGYLVFFADGLTANGPLHMNYKLSASGEQIGLYTTSLAVVDTVTFGAQTTDMAQARVPDGGRWFVPRTPTPGTTNGATW